MYASKWQIGPPLRETHSLRYFGKKTGGYHGDLINGMYVNIIIISSDLILDLDIQNALGLDVARGRPANFESVSLVQGNAYDVHSCRPRRRVER